MQSPYYPGLNLQGILGIYHTHVALQGIKKAKSENQKQKQKVNNESEKGITKKANNLSSFVTEVATQ